ncbi:MAG: hypothetical protein ACTSQR_06775 [Promethearchaeota archaeon]
MAIHKIAKMEISLPSKFERFESDIYSGKEIINFKNRHPIFKTLMKLEFEEVLRKYHKLTIIK